MAWSQADDSWAAMVGIGAKQANWRPLSRRNIFEPCDSRRAGDGGLLPMALMGWIGGSRRVDRVDLACHEAQDLSLPLEPSNAASTYQRATDVRRCADGGPKMKAAASPRHTGSLPFATFRRDRTP